MTRVTFVDGPLDGQTRDMDVVPTRLGDYHRMGLRYRYDPDRLLDRAANRQCRACLVIYDDRDDPTRPCPKCGSDDTTDQMITVFRGGMPRPYGPGAP